MKMKYEEMITQDTFERQYNSGNGKFNFRSSTFAMFSSKNLTASELNAANQNWKAHISIHPEDLAKAWDLIYPLLHKHAQQFKIINDNKLKVIRSEAEAFYKEAKIKHEEFVEKYLKNEFELKDLAEWAKKLPTNPSEYKHLLTEENKKELYEYIEAQLAKDEVVEAQGVEEANRLAEGMQITIYMSRGSENAHQKLFKQIEEVLVQNNIRPGVIYQTDRPLGPFISIRHPGVKYQDAVSAKNYNPDNAPDNFKNLNYKNVHSFEADLGKISKELQSLTVNDHMSANEKNNVQVKIALGKALEQKLSTFSNLDMPYKMKTLNDFKNDCTHAVKNADQQLKNDKEWRPLLKNLALLFSVIGTVASIISFGSRMVVGHYAFFDNKENLVEDSRKKTNFEFKEKYNQIQNDGTKDEDPDHATTSPTPPS
jgi:hypothetical protein